MKVALRPSKAVPLVNYIGVQFLGRVKCGIAPEPVPTDTEFNGHLGFRRPIFCTLSIQILYRAFSIA